MADSKVDSACTAWHKLAGGLDAERAWHERTLTSTSTHRSPASTHPFQTTDATTRHQHTLFHHRNTFPSLNNDCKQTAPHSGLQTNIRRIRIRIRRRA